jgi:hypothetical protein
MKGQRSISVHSLRSGGAPLPGASAREADSSSFARRRNDNKKVLLIASQQAPVML